ncbi:hypothetical protein [Fimbriiglobus ruber]|uniref:hypothetical protein n=1 Tax=Fimbriiglobus ruber TaxID=1908690 RepID=UPI000B4B1DBA|nr:hypothetical protein [Fimbriiglobus ruber]
MKISGSRKCDICQAEIPPKTTFRHGVLERQALGAFLNCDPDLQPTWQEVGDGSGKILMDICLECNEGMVQKPDPQDDAGQ